MGFACTSGLTELVIQVPDAPGTTKIFWMSEQENKIARARMDRAERLPSTVSIQESRQNRKVSNVPTITSVTRGPLSRAYSKTQSRMRSCLPTGEFSRSEGRLHTH